MAADPTALAERALEGARLSLLDAGSPAYTAVVVLPDRCELGPMVLASKAGVVDQARRLAADFADAEATVVVALHREGDRLKFVITDARSDDRLLIRHEVLEPGVEQQRGGWV